MVSYSSGVPSRMRDADVRAALLDHLESEFAGDPETLIIEELQTGPSRVDVAVINGKMHGFEIKSDADTLKRLPEQSKSYGRLFDYITIVSGRHHNECARRLLPEWWGITVAEPCDPIALVEIRPACPNPSPDAMSAARLLWRSEVLFLLEIAHQTAGIKSKPKEILYRRLVDTCAPDELRHLVREQLKTRVGWRTGPTPFRCGDSSQSYATPQGSQENREWLLSLEFPDLQN